MSDEVSQLTEVMVRQAKQSEQIKGIKDEVDDIKHKVCDLHSCLIGDGKHASLVMKVDRLEQARSRINAVLWFLFTSITTTFIGVAVAYFKGYF